MKSVKYFDDTSKFTGLHWSLVHIVLLNIAIPKPSIFFFFFDILKYLVINWAFVELLDGHHYTSVLNLNFSCSVLQILVNQEDHEDSRRNDDRRILGPARKLSISGLSHDQIRTNVINEIISTERDFVKHLRDVVKV